MPLIWGSSRQIPKPKGLTRKFFQDKDLYPRFSGFGLRVPDAPCITFGFQRARARLRNWRLAAEAFALRPASPCLRELGCGSKVGCHIKCGGKLSGLSLLARPFCLRSKQW